jgi:hypothetical protein
VFLDAAPGGVWTRRADRDGLEQRDDGLRSGDVAEQRGGFGLGGRHQR